MLPTEDIIPVTFVGGTGGNFLCHFIVSAKRNIHDIIELSTHGNSHENSLKDILVLNRGLADPDDEKLSYVFSQQPNSFEKPWHTAFHIQSLNTINNNFKRSIRVTYDLDDVNDIALCFYGKWFIDTINRDTTIKMRVSDSVYLFFTKKSLTEMNKFFCEIENMPNILFVSWKELFKGNIEELIAKISMFTHINIEHFSKEILIHWRNKTQYCIDKFKDIR
jgi:hypothetical protein